MDILDVLLASWQKIALGLILFAIIAILWHKNREAIGLFWLGFRQKNFLFGKIRSLSKNATVHDGWFHSETQICQDYKPHYQRINKSADYYTKCKEYLDLVGEIGRKPLSAVMMCGLFLVLLLEAWGFSYTMSGFIDLSASEDTRQIMASIVAISFAVSLATVTHLMGAEIHRNKLIDNIRSLWSVDQNAEPALTQQAGIGSASIENPTDIHAKPYIRRLNRLALGKSTKSFIWIITTVVLVVIIAVMLTFVRMKALEMAQTQDTMCDPTTVQSTDNGFPVFDAISNEIPDEVIENNKEAKQKGNTEICKATEQGSWWTFGMLAILFIMLQAFSTWVSTAYGFAGKQSKKAYYFTHKHNTAVDFSIYYENKAREIADLAQKSLVRLQTKMADRLAQTGTSSEGKDLVTTASSRTFYSFLSKDHADQVHSEINNKKVNDRAELIKHEMEINKQNSVEKINKSRKTDEELLAELRAEMEEKRLAEEPKESEEQQRARLMVQLEAEHEPVESEKEQRDRLLAQLNNADLSTNIKV